MSMAVEEKVAAFLDRVECMRSQAAIPDTVLYDVVHHRLSTKCLAMLVQKDPDAVGSFEVSTYQGMKRWLEEYEKIAAVSDELHRGATTTAAAGTSKLQDIREDHDCERHCSPECESERSCRWDCGDWGGHDWE